MNDPKEQPIDVEEQKSWLQEHRKENGLSWNDIHRSSGIPAGTLSSFAGGTYAGSGDNVAMRIFRYRQTLASQKTVRGQLPEAPEYYETPTSQKIVGLLNWAQRGRMVLVPMAAGLGKTKTGEHFKACNSNVFMATCSSSTASVHAIQHCVLRALNSINTVGSMQVLSQRIIEIAKDKDNALLILDEAQHLTVRALEEVRSWHDASGIGIALLGNEGLLHRIEGGGRSADLAQLFSRIAAKGAQSKPLAEDVDIMLYEWGLTEEKACDLVHQIAMKPGGLRVATFALEMAIMMAKAGNEDLQARHIGDAWLQLSSRGAV